MCAHYDVQKKVSIKEKQKGRLARDHIVKSEMLTGTDTALRHSFLFLGVRRRVGGAATETMYAIVMVS